MKSTRIYSLISHGLALAVGYFFMAAAATIVFNVLKEGFQIEALVMVAMGGLIATIAYRFLGRAKALHATDSHLEYGLGRWRRRVPLSDVAFVAHPFWTRFNSGGLFPAPIEITLRSGRTLLVYHRAEGLGFLRARIGGNFAPDLHGF